MLNYTTYPGIFPCKTCKEDVKTCRVYPDTGESTWLCSKKHLSKCQLYIVGYKKKRDYERKERE
jgi:hypothetical protein